MFFCRSKTLDCEYEVHTDLASIQEKWDALLPESHPLKSPFLLMTERCQFENLKFAYLLIYKNKKAIGLAYLQLIGLENMHLPEDFLNQKKVQLFQKWILGNENWVVLCGHLFRIDYPSFFFPEPKNKALIFQVLYHFSKQNPLRMKALATILKDAETMHPACGFAPFQEDVLMQIDLNPAWENFDDYLSGITKKYRQRALKILHQGKDLEMRELNLSELKKHQGEMYALYLQVLEKQTLKFGKLSENYFEEMKFALGSQFKVWGYFLNGKMLAFSSHFYKRNGKMEVHYIGFDDKENDQFALYFNILFDGIRAGIAAGMASVEYGRTSLEAKANLGCQPIYPVHYFLLGNGLSGLGLKYLVKWNKLRESNAWKKRNPLKLTLQNIEATENEAIV
jgi:hypothetical protein